MDDLSRVEGHGRITVEVGPTGDANMIELNIFEGPRFFEALVRKRHYSEVPSVVSRICAICSVGHRIASIHGIESALDLHVPSRVRLLRELLVHGMFIESHILHLYFLALPDFLGASGALLLVPSHPDAVYAALRLKKLGNAIQEVVGGRAIHPENPVVGGFGKAPGPEELARLRDELVGSLPAFVDTTRLFMDLDYPELDGGENVFYALEPAEQGFGYLGHMLVGSDGTRIPADLYREVFTETTVPHSTAKHSFARGQSYMVGALARLNLFGGRLAGRPGELFREAAGRTAGFRLPSHNPLHNNPAQAIEAVYSAERAIDIIKELLGGDGKDVSCDPGPRASLQADLEPSRQDNPQDGSGSREARGVGAIEAPRGTLFHDYTLDGEGKVIRANVVTPTAQNLANIERFIRHQVSRLHADGKENLVRSLEVLVRAYDPCISCSTHLVELKPYS